MKFNALIPELSVSDLSTSLEFYTEVLGFKIEYQRPMEKFVFLSLDEAQMMLEETNHHWSTGILERPFGRGINFQIEVANLDPILNTMKARSMAFFKAPEERWYKTGDVSEGVLEFLIQDPDGYLLRFTKSLGQKPAT